ncbi:hypothetical protein J7413_08660 [Shimia sp. R10_1]|uniref:hypothetical protein n=1 Tax=Shimia sp. R10_1 TaxID=2821095 RepID=UPI001ADC36F6|nr:hypothetical protein [Shimia sp. R10_1]MBO9473607.1 hypothetical protein [Shimia sp. R10_1]
MSRRRWHILREGDRVTVARRLPVRWDVAAETTLPDACRVRVAQQVRQDMWRALQDLRGFAPVVQVTRVDGGLHVVAGGEVAGAVARQKLEADISQVLNCPKRRVRWIRHAQPKKVLA